MKRPATKTIILVLFIIMLLTLTLVTAVVFQNPVQRAILLMGWGVVLFWIVIGGGLMYQYRDALAGALMKLKWPNYLLFFCLSVALFFLEEVVTTSMTNLAPVFGAPLGSAAITFTSNYFTAVFYHSLPIVGVLIIIFTWIFFRFRLSATQMFFFFGIAGYLIETTNNPNNFLNVPFWIFVYGLMVWLPAYATAVRLDQTEKIL